jgi:alanyl-tRNA synthetase
MSDEEIKKVEDIVNGKIWEQIEVETSVSKMEDAVKAGAIAVFDEKYEDVVRVVKVGNFSMELCGGTHVSNTGNIGVFKILKESSPGAGMRRIEGVTLKGLLDRFSSHDNIISKLSTTMSVSEEDIVKRYEEMIERTKSLEKEIQKLKKGNVSSELDTIISSAKDVSGVKIVSHIFRDVDPGHLRDLSDSVRAKEQNSIVCFGSEYEGKALLLFAATKNSVEKGADCGKIIKEVSKHVEGGGGGRKDLAQAGGKSPVGLEKAISEGAKVAEKMVK